MTYKYLDEDITITTAFQLLRGLIPDLDANRCIKDLRRFGDIISEWNDYAHLISSRDLSRKKAHIVDSLSLVPILDPVVGLNGLLLDIGSGGGFPAIVLKIVLPGLPMVLMERDRKKAAFLKKIVGMFAFEDTDVVEGSFPASVPDGDYRVITARAVDKPSVILPAIARFLTSEASFICQSPRGEEYFGTRFDFEVVDDDWDRLGLRRGSIRIYRPSSATSN